MNDDSELICPDPGGCNANGNREDCRWCRKPELADVVAAKRAEITPLMPDTQYRESKLSPRHKPLCSYPSDGCVTSGLCDNDDCPNFEEPTSFEKSGIVTDTPYGVTVSHDADSLCKGRDKCDGKCAKCCYCGATQKTKLKLSDCGAPACIHSFPHYHSTDGNGRVWTNRIGHDSDMEDQVED